MHSISEIGTNVPAFLAKLWRMVEDPMTNDLISWCSMGDSFEIKNATRLSRDLLPMYYKHNNMASFIRQLNMYGFHKIMSSDCKQDSEEMKFMHPNFIQGHPYLLENIKRKITVTRGPEKPSIMNKMLNDVRQMKGKQDSMDSKLLAMKRENEALWRELSHMRHKHKKQQHIVNKLIQYLILLIQSNHLPVTRRGFPLMLKDKVGHYSSVDCSSKSPTGPVIHELDSADLLLEDITTEPTVSSSESSPELLENIDSIDSDENPAIKITENEFPENFLTVEDSKIPSHIKHIASLKKENDLLGKNILVPTYKPQAKSKKRLNQRRVTKVPAKKQKKESTPVQYVVTQVDNDKFALLPSAYNMSLQNETSPIVDLNTDSPLQQETSPVSIVQDWVASPSPVLSPSRDKLIGSPIIEAILSPDVAETPPNTMPSESTIDPLAFAVTDPEQNMQIACMDSGNNGNLNRLGSKEEMDNHVESVQADLDSFKELLKTEGITLDANALLGLLNEDSNLPPCLLNNSDDDSINTFSKQKEFEGNELMMYNSPLFDLTDIINANEWNLLEMDEDPQASQEDAFKDLHTPQFMENSPSFPTTAKTKKT